MKQIFPLSALLLSTSVGAQFGVLDPTFDGDGIVQTTIGNASLAQAVAVQPDGKILVGGNSDSSAVIVRYLPDGSLDATFGTGGIVVLDVWDIAAIGDIAVQPDGKIVACGRISTAPFSDFLLARFDPDGSLDAGFGLGSSGQVYVDFAGFQSTTAELAIQPDGKIVLAGYTYAPTTSVRIMRFTTAGLTDNGTFGTSGGTSTFTISGALTIDVRGMALQPDGRILFCGTVTDGSNTDRYVARLLTDGSLDAGFGTAGVKRLDAGISATERGSDVVVQADGKIFVVAYVATSDQHVQVTRLLSDGTVDGSYGTGGDAIGPSLGGDVFTQQGILQSDGKLVFAGHYYAGSLIHALWRVNTDGTFDNTFGTAGQVLQPFGTGDALLFDVAQQADGKLLLCGQVVADQQFITARLTSGQVGMEESGLQDPLLLFPDPVDDHFTVNVDDAIGDRPVIVRDMTGRMVPVTSTIRSGGATIDASGLSPGTYTVTVRMANGDATARFVKE